jgi:hypothetical protein
MQPAGAEKGNKKRDGVSQWAAVALIRLQSILSLTAFISSPWLPGMFKPIPLFPVTALFHVTNFSMNMEVALTPEVLVTIGENTRCRILYD